MRKPRLANLLSLAWPMIVSRSTQAVIGLSDALMTAHLGEASLAAVTTGALDSFAILIFPFGIAFIISSFSSQLAGRKDFASARRYGWYGLVLGGIAEVMALVTLPLIRPIIAHLGYAPDVTETLIAYLSVRILSAGPAVGLEALGNYYGGLGNTSVLMRANTAAMLLNLPLNLVLINGYLGLPKLGVTGAALANVLATTIAFLGFLTYFLREGRTLRQPHLKMKEFVRVLRFGIPSGLNWAFEFFAFVTFVNVVIGGLGTTSLAAMMSVMQINSISFMPAFGIASAGSILVGQAIGAKRANWVPSIAWLTFRTAATWMALVACAYWLIPRLLLAPFVPGTATPEFMTIGLTMLTFSAFWQLFDAVGMTYSEALRAAGDTSFTMWARGLIAWGVWLPGALISVRFLGGGEKAAIAWLLIYLALLAATLYTRFALGAWRKIILVEPTPNS